MRFTEINALRAELTEEELSLALAQVEKCTEKMNREEKRAFAEGLELANMAWVQGALSGGREQWIARKLSALYVAAYEVI